LAWFSGQPTSGPQNAGEPKANGGGQWGSRGAKPPWQGVWGVWPFRPNPLTPFPAREGGNFSPPRSGEGPGERLTPTSGTQNVGKPSACGGGQMGGSRGAKPPWRGVVGGVPPQNQKRGQVASISNPAHEWDPERWQTLSLRGWANGGSRGA